MTLFEYISVAVSIMLSLGIAHLLTRVPDVFDRTRFYWIHAGWVALLLGTLIAHWWIFWNYRDVSSWSAFSFTYVIASPAILFLLASVLVPRESDEVESWRSHYDRVRPAFFGLQIVFFLHVTGQLSLVLGLSLLHPLRALHAAFIALSITAALSSSHAIHTLVLVAWLAATLGGGWFLLQPGGLTAS